MLYGIILVSLYAKNQWLITMKEKTIITVFMVKERKSYYFGSVAAIFTVFDSNDIGFTEKYLQHAGLGAVASDKAIIKRCPLIVKKKKGNA